MAVQRRRFALAALAAAFCAAPALGEAVRAAERPVAIVALGDSLTAGFGLAAKDAFPAQLERALAAKGIAAKVANAGVSGDTASGGAARADWSVPEGTDAVIVELGANDALRGVDPQVTRAALDRLLRRLTERGIAVLLCGMLAPPNLGRDYAAAFEAVFRDLAAAHGALLYPFFLDGVSADPPNLTLTQGDGLHPTAAGTAVIVERILPKVEELVGRVKGKRG